MLDNFDALMRDVHELAVEKGFYEGASSTDQPTFVASKIALIHSELSEALEAVRDFDPPDGKLPEFSALTMELADAVIRIMDLAAFLGLPLGSAIVLKHRFNTARPYKHGKEL
jgi:NTP pyrophosphatase (non-canonical NTP hydrolase)